MATVVWSIFQFIYFVCFVMAMTLLYENKKIGTAERLQNHTNPHII